MIFVAMAGPTPGSFSRSTSLALFRSNLGAGAAGAGGGGTRDWANAATENASAMPMAMGVLVIDPLYLAALQHVLQRDCDGQSANRFHDVRVFCVEAAYAIHDGGILTLGMRGDLLDLLRRDLVGLLRRY